jgi:DNA-binding transcriptional ArsR family regulator
MMIDVFILDTEERIKAFTHPYRMRLVHVFRETRRPMTATEVARIIGDGPGRVHYHMRILEAAGIVAVVRTESVNGIIARYYEPTARHYSVGDAARGAVGGEPVRDEVARMISRRFRDGLRAFLDRTIGDSEDAADEPAGARGDEAFLFEHLIHCNDQEWLAFRESIEELAARHAGSTPGSRPRRVFVAGATDRPAGWSRPLSKTPRQRDRDWPPHPQPER